MNYLLEAFPAWMCCFVLFRLVGMVRIVHGLHFAKSYGWLWSMDGDLFDYLR